jgi:exopolysaccharide biosynthesis polyprenyl glycosylphosphotransferase
MTHSRKTALVFLAVDLLTAVLVFNIVSSYRGIATHFIFGALAAPLAALVAAIYLIDGYSSRTDMLSIDYISQHTIAVLAALLVTLLLTFAVFPEGYELHSSRGVLTVSFLVLIPLTIGYRRLVYVQSLSSRSGLSFIYLGDAASCGVFREECWKMGLQRPVILTAIGAGAPERKPALPNTLSRPLGEVLSEVTGGRLGVEGIVLREANLERPPDIVEQLMQLAFQGIPTYTLEYFHERYWKKVPLHRINPAWLFQEGFDITREPVFDRLKRLSDIVLSGIGLVLAAPLIALAVAAIWIEDGAPAFFRQTRIGRHRKPFQLLKLRSMRRSSSQADPYTREDDVRVTRVGRIIRAARLDELPQLWNVLRGDMSLIGPRAEWDRLVADYERAIPCYHFRHLVKPGITGWAQVNYLYGANIEDTVRKLEYDLYYIRHFSFRLDASIVLKTIHIMLFGKGR